MKEINKNFERKNPLKKSVNQYKCIPIWLKKLKLEVENTHEKDIFKLGYFS